MRLRCTIAGEQLVEDAFGQELVADVVNRIGARYLGYDTGDWIGEDGAGRSIAPGTRVSDLTNTNLRATRRRGHDG